MFAVAHDAYLNSILKVLRVSRSGHDGAASVLVARFVRRLDQDEPVLKDLWDFENAAEPTEIVTILRWLCGVPETRLVSRGNLKAMRC